MNREVFLSLLALDSYNRGYGGTLNDLGEEGQIGNATVRKFKPGEQDGWQAAGFYAIAYDWNNSNNTETVISFRGTNFPDLKNVTESAFEAFKKDLWGGWNFFLGFDRPNQADFARAFYENVTQLEFRGVPGFVDPLLTDLDVTLTGHSLGGALAGYVGARADARAFIFDPIPFGDVATADGLSAAFSRTVEELGLENIQDIGSILPTLLGSAALFPDTSITLGQFVNRLAENIRAASPRFENVEGHFLQGEVAQQIPTLQTRIGQALNTLGGLIPGSFLGLLATALGVQQSIQGQINAASSDRSGVSEIGNRGLPDEYKFQINFIENNVALHSMAWLTLILFGEKQWAPTQGGEGRGSDWEKGIKFILPSTSDDAIGRSLGLGPSTGTGSAGTQLSYAIAYSVLKEGTLVYGDTGARALFDDAGDVGRLVLQAPKLFGEDIRGVIGTTIAEFAGLLAVNKIEASAFSSALNGIVEGPGAQSSFHIATGKEYWSKFVKNGVKYSSSNAGALTRDLLSTNLNSAAARATFNSWLSRAGADRGAQANPLTPAERYADFIDMVSISFGGNNLIRSNFEADSGGFELILGLDADQSDGNSSSYRNTFSTRREIAIGGDGGNHFLGLGGNDALISGAGEDILDGGEGDDLLVGGRSVDNLVGGSGKDILYAGDLDQVEDNARDILTGGSGDDIFYIGNGDRITDIDRGDTVFLRGKRLSGGKETKPGSRIFLDEQGGRFVWAADGALTYSINPTISIERFRNGYGGIRLIEAEDDDEDGDGGRPDFDDAERLRDPLIIDLNGDRNVIFGRDSVAAYFDIDNDGFAERVSWARAGDGFLVRDLNGNGLIDSGIEMFGTGTVDSSAGRLLPFGQDGFLELGLLDSNFDGAITAADVQFSQLRVWIDANLDAKTDAGELVTLELLGIVSISLRTFDSDHVAITNDASVITRASTVGFADGSTRTIYDAYLSIDQFDARELADDVTIDERIADLPFLLGSGNVSDLDIAMSRDPGLAELVREFSELGIDKAHEILARAQQILFRWTGADHVAPDSRGPNINAQWLHALEAITGEDFVQGGIGSNPRGDGAGILIGEWQSLVTRTAARLVGQIPLGKALTPGLSFEAAAFFTVAEGTTLDSVLASAKRNEPTTKSEAIGYWAALVEILGMYREFLPIEGADGTVPLTPEFDARLSAALSEAGIPFALRDLRHILTVSAGEDKVVGRTRNFLTSPNDLILVQDDAGRVDGAGGDDVYVVGKDVGALDIIDASGENELVLSDFVAADITVVAVVEDGRSWLRISDTSGALNLRVRVDVDVDSIETAVQSVRFGDGTTSNILELIEGGGAALGVLFAADGAQPVAGTTADDLIVGVGVNNSYLFARGAGSDTIFDLSGEGDRVIVAGNVSDIEFTAGRTDDGDDLILRFRDTGESLRVVGHRSDRGREIEIFEFADATLTMAQVDSILNSGSPSNDTIVGSRRDDLISGFAGNDILQGMAGRDTYLFDLGWGQDRIVEADSGNAIVFGASVRVDDITAERGSNGDLVLRSSAGDKITIVGGLRSPVLTSFAFADGTTKTLTDIVDQLLAGGTNTISGTAADEELIGTAESETFVGNGGNDTFRGFGGVDFYRIDAPFTRVFGSAEGIDTLIAPTGAALADLRFDDDRHVFVFGRNGPVVYADSELDYVRFSDGSLVDLTGPAISLGTAGNDFLYSTGRAPTTFRSGAGNDVMIGSAKESALDTYEFEVGFGNDTIYDLGGQADRITFLSPELSVANATFQKIGSNLVIAFNSGDRLTIEGHFWNYSYDNGIPDLLGQDSGGIEFFTFGDGQSFAGVNSFLSSVTAGDDLVMSGSFAGLRDGGAGNDILFGGREANTYIFRAGYGHDIIKDDGGNNQSVRFFGLEPDDVVITRDPSDPFSIVFTIAATGETLTIDGSPDDGFLPDRDPRAALNERGLNIQQFVFDSATLIASEILDRVFAAEGTDGDNVVWGINSDRDIRPGLGNDIVHIGNGQERVVIGPNGGSKIITFDPDGSRPGSGPLPFSVFFEGVSLDSLVLVEVNEANGQVGIQRLKAAFARCRSSG
jgi:Ca2+-binding RTX toxin-like protein